MTAPRLLPDNPDQGWTPYAWLIYAVPFAILPAFFPVSRLFWVAHIAGLAAFLALYFGGFWLSGYRKLISAAGLFLLGTSYSNANPGSSVFFVFAASFISELPDMGIAAKLLLALIGIEGLEAWMLQWPLQYWVLTIAFTALVGSVTMHYAQRRRVNRRLKLAQEEVERMAKIAERERISRDLHDLLGHTLSIIVLKSELAARLAGTNPDRSVAEIKDVERISREALGEVRAAVRGYRSAGFTHELEHARQTLETAGVEVECSFQPGADAIHLSPSQEGVFVLALREAVTNIVRHARATACHLAVRGSETACELEIADNGRGGNAPEGFGLTGMRARVESLGGSFSRENRFAETASGTRLVIQLPLL